MSITPLWAGSPFRVLYLRLVIHDPHLLARAGVRQRGEDQ